MEKTESSLVRANKWNRELEQNLISDIGTALHRIYDLNEVSFQREFSDGNQMIVIVDGYSFRIEVNKIRDQE